MSFQSRRPPALVGRKVIRARQARLLSPIIAGVRETFALVPAERVRVTSVRPENAVAHHIVGPSGKCCGRESEKAENC